MISSLTFSQKHQYIYSWCKTSCHYIRCRFDLVYYILPLCTVGYLQHVFVC